MGSVSVVYGMIKLNDSKSYQMIVKDLKTDKNYPWIRAEMFNLNSIEHPYFYESPIATFGTTYKNLSGGTEWSEFILKYEYLLDKLDFEYTRVRLETEFLGDFEFFWGKKTGRQTELYAKKDLIEREKWFFGYGFRQMFGGLITEGEPAIPFDFRYPIEFDKDIKYKFNKMISDLNQIQLKTKKYFKDYASHKVLGDDKSHLILTYLRLNKVIEYGWELENGFFITRLKEIKPIHTPYNVV
ncbi:MAG: hypothetical protein WA958_10775 [Tunicatimonas sp.]